MPVAACFGERREARTGVLDPRQHGTRGSQGENGALRGVAAAAEKPVVGALAGLIKRGCLCPPSSTPGKARVTAGRLFIAATRAISLRPSASAGVARE